MSASTRRRSPIGASTTSSTTGVGRKPRTHLQVHYFSAMRDALRATGRRIFYSINPNSSDDAAAGTRVRLVEDRRHEPQLGRSGSRMGRRRRCGLSGLAGVVQGARCAIPQADRSGPTHINDPDMMVVGLGWNEFVRTHPTMSSDRRSPA